MTHRVKGWSKFQHFKDRKPPWIKLYRDILDDMEWHELDAVAAKALVMIWLIASENDGVLPPLKTLAFRLRMTEKQAESIVSKLGHWLERDDINAISTRYQETRLETEEETERETEKPAAQAPFSLPDWINKTHWDAWHSSPKRKKATDAQKQLAVDKLAKWRAEGIDYATALENAAVGGWQGLFLPDKGKPTNVQTLTVPARNGRDPELERLERDRDRAVAPSLAVLEQMAKIRMGAKA